jgi:hypothetical protein
MKKNVASTPPNSLDPNFCKVHKQPFTLYCEIDAIIICDFRIFKNKIIILRFL